MTKRPSKEDLRIAADWLRNDAECADIDATRAHEVEAIERVHEWLREQGDKPKRRARKE